MLLAVVFVVATLLLLVARHQKRTNAMCTSTARLDGKTALVTGGTAGMGLEIAKDFAKRGARVIVVCPFEKEGVNGRKEIVAASGNENVVYQHLDLASLKSVRNFAQHILATEERLDILVNNAGVGIPATNDTEDGLNFIMQVNYFGHFLLTILLLPLLKKSKAGRIVNTASILHNLGFNLRVDHLNSNHWSKIWIYGKSKFCTIPFSRELTRRIKDSSVVVNSVDPGAVGTAIFHSVPIPFAGDIVSFFFKHSFKTPREGAQTAIYVAVDDTAGKISGELFKNCKLTRGVKWAYNDELAAKLWEESVKCVKLTKEELKECFQSFA
ncbi:retinol dehydrogenase 11-like [Plutella xylostella]|uniref:retinol dehydrogenase 11-like n=1 Tax=Plutella xylostella TaxID=51655 RepID=UPI002032440F|nr:retinol dehydrogenase 11-like [Plutella xylostella]